MNTFLAILCVALVACTAAKPGYNYPRPQQTILTSAPVSTNSVISLQQSQPLASFNLQSQPQFASAQPVQYGSQLQYASTIPQQYTVPASAPVVQQFVSATPQQLAPVQQQTFHTGTTPVVTSNQVQYQQPKQQIIVNKEIFIHAAPEETEVINQQQDIEAGPIRKNYRIVFIKAPVQNFKLNVQAIKQAQAANEEKTVIYVLSKKPDYAKIQSELVNVQSVEKTSKPEVFFIKYKTQEEANRAQQEIQAQYDALGGSTRVSDEGIAPITSVIGSVSQNAVSSGSAVGSNFFNVGSVAPVSVSSGSNQQYNALGGSTRVTHEGIAPITSVIGSASQNAVSSVSALGSNFVNVGSVAPVSVSSGSNQQQFIKKFVHNGSSNVSYGINAKILNAKNK